MLENIPQSLQIALKQIILSNFPSRKQNFTTRVHIMRLLQTGRRPLTIVLVIKLYK